jgi:hypothetical protein
MPFNPPENYNLPFIPEYNPNELSLTEIRKDGMLDGRQAFKADLIKELSTIRPRPEWVKEALRYLKRTSL